MPKEVYYIDRKVAEIATLLSLRWCLRLTWQTQEHRVSCHAKPVPVGIQGKECGYTELQTLRLLTDKHKRNHRWLHRSFGYSTGQEKLAAGSSSLNESLSYLQTVGLLRLCKKTATLFSTQSLSRLEICKLGIQYQANAKDGYKLKMQADGNLVHITTTFPQELLRWRFCLLDTWIQRLVGQISSIDYQC